MRLRFVVAIFALALAPLAAQDAEEEGPPSPRQVYQQAVVLFSQGHVFSGEEAADLDKLRGELVDSGDADLAASLDLLRLGSEASASIANRKAAASPEQDALFWSEREARERGSGDWRAVRDGGLLVFTASVASALLLAVTIDRNDGYLRNGFFVDWHSRQRFQYDLYWALGGAGATAFVSLFPLLWGESRQ